MVPVQLAKTYPDILTLYFGGCGQKGTMFHSWWTCQKIEHSWIKVFTLIYSVTSVNLTKKALFNDLIGG